MTDAPSSLDYAEVRGQIQDLDVIAFRGRGIVSRAIRLFTGGRVTHVGMAVRVGPRLMLLESREGRGARLVWLSREIDGQDVSWLRPRVEIPAEARAKAMDWALRAAGSGYSYRGVLRFVWRCLGLRLADDDRLAFGNRFCSEFVSATYRIAGVDLAPELRDSETAPEHVARSAALVDRGRLEVVPT